MPDSTKKMLINVDDDETRIAMITGNTLDSLHIEQTYHKRIVGNIYRGRVVKVQTSFQAAFIDYGADRHGFLALSDVNFSLFKGAQGRRGRPSIDKILKPGQPVMVQVTRNELGHKGASLTTNISLPGRFLVFMPNSEKGGVSKKIEDVEARTRLKHLLEGLCGEKDSAIIRTVGVDRTLSELKRDFMVLRRKWNQIEGDYENSPNAELLYQEEGVVVRTLRDYYVDDIEEVLIDHAESFQRSREFFKAAIPDKQKRLQFYLGDRSLFSAYGIEKQIEQLSSNHVPLPSGGSLVIDPTEALVAIDVNSGKYRQSNNIEDTAAKINLEAAEEVSRQLRLRNLGGLIVIDFIDMISEKNRNAVIKKLEEHMQGDKAKWTVGGISQFGLLEMSRQRIATALSQETKTVCPTCGGMGLVLSVPSLANAVLRKIREIAATGDVSEMNGQVPVELLNYLFNKKRAQLDELEIEFGIKIFLHGDQSIESGKLPSFDVTAKAEGRFTEGNLVEENTLSKNQKPETHPEDKSKKTKPRRQNPKTSNEPVTSESSSTEGRSEEKPSSQKAEDRPTEDGSKENSQKAASESKAAPDHAQKKTTPKNVSTSLKTPLFSSVHQVPPDGKVTLPGGISPQNKKNNGDSEKLKNAAPGTILFSSAHRGSAVGGNGEQTIKGLLEKDGNSKVEGQNDGPRPAETLKNEQRKPTPQKNKPSGQPSGKSKSGERQEKNKVKEGRNADGSSAGPRSPNTKKTKKETSGKPSTNPKERPVQKSKSKQQSSLSSKQKKSEEDQSTTTQKKAATGRTAQTKKKKATGQSSSVQTSAKAKPAKPTQKKKKATGQSSTPVEGRSTGKKEVEKSKNPKKQSSKPATKKANSTGKSSTKKESKSGKPPRKKAEDSASSKGKTEGRPSEASPTSAKKGNTGQSSAKKKASKGRSSAPKKAPSSSK